MPADELEPKWQRVTRILEGLREGDLVQLVARKPGYYGHAIVLSAPYMASGDPHIDVILGDRVGQLRFFRRFEALSLNFQAGPEKKWVSVFFGNVTHVKPTGAR